MRNIQVSAARCRCVAGSEGGLLNICRLRPFSLVAPTPLQCAWVFMLLARQAGLDVVLLAVPPIAKSGSNRRPWVAALFSSDDFYLFDFTYGLPIPGPNGEGIATLRQGGR